MGKGTGLEGGIANLQRRFENTESEFVKTRLHQYMSEQPCPTCLGTRLKKEALAVRLHAAEEPLAGDGNDRAVEVVNSDPSTNGNGRGRSHARAPQAPAAHAPEEAAPR